MYLYATAMHKAILYRMALSDPVVRALYMTKDTCMLCTYADLYALYMTKVWVTAGAYL